MTKNRKKAPKTAPKLSKIVPISLILVCIGGLGYLFLRNTQKTADYIVETNAFFAPFEYYEGREIKGVDVDIINRVAEKLGKTITIKDVEFDVIIDNVEAGKIADAGAAGLTITEARAAKVDFTIPYYTSVQYAIFNKNSINYGDYLTWQDLAGKTLGSQTGGTGFLFAETEIEEGSLAGTDTIIKGFDTHQLAADAIASQIVDFAIADELAAQYIVAKNANLVAVPLCHLTENGAVEPVEESYAIAVNKNQPELLAAFNEVLTEMLEKDTEGQSEIDQLILKHMGL